MTTWRDARRLAVAGLVFAGPAQALTVIGAGPMPVEVDIAALPRTSVVWTVHGKTVTCAGPWLADVLAKAGVPSGEAARRAVLAEIVVARGADGYKVAFGLGDLDHTLGNAPVIVADRCDGRPLSPEDGPLRLVAAKDTRGARSVRQLVELKVGPAL